MKRLFFRLFVCPFKKHLTMQEEMKNTYVVFDLTCRRCGHRVFERVTPCH